MTIKRYDGGRLWVLTMGLALGAWTATGCGSPRTPAPEQAATTPGASVAPDQVKQATIAGIYDAPVTLINGVYEGPPFAPGAASRPRVILVPDLVRLANLDGIDGDEAAVLLAENSGGSGEMVYLSVVGLIDGAPRSLGTVRVGDRTKVRSFLVSNGEIVMEVVEAGPNDPMCCPTQLATKRFAMVKGALSMTKSEVAGTLSMAILSGVEWTLVGMDFKPLPEAAKPPTLGVDGERLAGFSGCNRYNGTITETAPGQVSIGPLAGTRMACPSPASEVEARFLAALGVVTQYSFVAGKLALSGADGNAMRTLLFARP